MQLQEICVSSATANLAEIADFVAERAALAGLDEERVFAVQMAVDEACTNSMQHAYEGRADGEVRICCYVDDDDFVVQIFDHGKRFDPEAVPEPDLASPLEERAIGGLGVFFMRRLMDCVEFTADEGGNLVTLRKAIK